MIFKKSEAEERPDDGEQDMQVNPSPPNEPTLLIAAPSGMRDNQTFQAAVQDKAAPLRVQSVAEGSQFDIALVQNATAALSIYQELEALDQLLDALIKVRAARKDGTPYLIIAQPLKHMQKLGVWLEQRAKANTLEGIRLVLANSEEELLRQLQDKFQALDGSSIIRMPENTEVRDTAYKHFYAISPLLHELVRAIEALAANNIERIYLLGGPGTGKTSLAYYYWLKRNKGRFITVNLAAESTGDKAAMKSLLCGHVTGAFPGANTREGAFSFAEDGVCFLDESHGVTGIVMQVLMEALDGNQYLPYGATKKRRLECAVVFASNRSWEALRDLMNPDEHARLGATVISVPDLSKRKEDLMAVACVSLAKFSERCTSWDAPIGFTEAAWERLINCKWRGNVRTLIRVVEAGATEFARFGHEGDLLDVQHIEEAMRLWEPNKMKHEEIYASY